MSTAYAPAALVRHGNVVRHTLGAASGNSLDASVKKIETSPETVNTEGSTTGQRP